MSKTERNSEIIRLAKEGKELKEIGSLYSISRERVRQILEEGDVSASKLKLERLKEVVEERIKNEGIANLTSDKNVNRYFKKVKGLTAAEMAKKDQVSKCLLLHSQKKKPSEIAKELNIHRSTVYSLLASMGITISSNGTRQSRNAIIKQLAKEGVSQAEIASKLSLTTTQVSNIINDRKKPYDPERYRKYKSRLNQLNNTKNGNN